VNANTPGHFSIGSREFREKRLLSDLEALRALAADSTIFSFEPTGEPPDRYRLTFRGKGLAPDSTKSGAKTIEQHQCDLRLPYSYPEQPPDIRWLTPVLHPNVSFSGCIQLAEIGLPWSPEVGLDLVCERLWDMARMAYADDQRAVNYSAKNWLEAHGDMPTPLDPRGLRDKSEGKLSSGNIVRYQRRGAAMKTPGASGKVASAAPPAADLFYIGDDSPAASHRSPAGYRAAGRPMRSPAASDDILFIDE
jgi:ubiquitin-protein ligase